MIPHCQATWRADTSVRVCTQRCSSVIHEMYGWKWADSVSRCVLGVYHWRRVVVVVMGEQRCAEEEVSFICIWHTSLLCYSDSTIILITACLPLTPPPPSPFHNPLLLLFLLTRKMMYLQTDLQHFQHFSFQLSYEKSPMCAGTELRFQVEKSKMSFLLFYLTFRVVYLLSYIYC